MKIIICIAFALTVCTHASHGAGAYKNVVVTNNGYCTLIARELIAKGGNAREVFIAASLCEGMVHPMDSGLGGGFQAVYYNFKNNRTNALYIDSREQSPSDGKFMEEPFTLGNSIGIPSVLAGYETLYNIDRRENKLNWTQIIQPVLDLCHTGFYVSRASKEMFSILFESFNNTRMDAHHMHNSKLCGTLTQMMKDGPSSSLYKKNGFLQRWVLNDLKGVGSFISSKDLRGYRVKVDSPASVKFDKYTAYASKVPGSGQAILFALKLIEKLRTLMRPTTSATEKMVYLLKILKYTYALQPHLRELSEGTINKIIDKSAHSLAEGIVKGGIKIQNTIPTKFGEVVLAKMVSPVHSGTTNVVIKVGNSGVTGSSSINYLFGSGIVSKLGFFYNNHLRDFSNPNWRRKNKALKNAPGPSKTPSSSISPVVMVDAAGEPVLQIGSAGGGKIISAVVGTLFNYFVLHKSLEDSVKACRILPKFNYARNRINFLYECIDDQRIASQLTKNGLNFRADIAAGYSAVTAFSKIGRIPEAVFDPRRGGHAIHTSG